MNDLVLKELYDECENIQVQIDLLNEEKGKLIDLYGLPSSSIPSSSFSILTESLDTTTSLQHLSTNVLLEEEEEEEGRKDKGFSFVTDDVVIDSEFTYLVEVNESKSEESKLEEEEEKEGFTPLQDEE